MGSGNGTGKNVIYEIAGELCYTLRGPCTVLRREGRPGKTEGIRPDTRFSIAGRTDGEGDPMTWKCPRCGRVFDRQDQQHFCEKPRTIDDYIEAQDPSIQPKLREIRSVIRSAVPEAEERISWSMPTYWKGRNLIHFAASKKHIGLYPGGEATTAFAKELEGFDISKGTIRLPYDKDLPRELIMEIAKWCYERNGK